MAGSDVVEASTVNIKLWLAHLTFGVCDAMAVAPNGGEDADMVARRKRAQREEQPQCLRFC